MRRLNLLPLAAVLLVVGFLVGVLYTQWPQLTRQAVPTPTMLFVPPGGRLILPPEPIAGPPEANPTLTLHISVADIYTNQLVVARAVKLDDQILYQNVTEFEVTLPGRLTDRRVYLSIEADGYELWQLGFRHNLNHSRDVYFIAALKPIKP